MRVAQSKMVFDDPALWGRDGSWGLEGGRVIAPMQYAKVLQFHGVKQFLTSHIAQQGAALHFGQQGVDARSKSETQAAKCGTAKKRLHGAGVHVETWPLGEAGRGPASLELLHCKASELESKLLKSGI